MSEDSPEKISDLPESLNIPKIGEDFFTALAEYLAKELQVDYISIGLLSNQGNTIRTIIFFGKGKMLDNIEYKLAGTPYQEVIDKGSCIMASAANDKFESLKDLAIEAFLGCSLTNESGETIGLISILHTKPITNTQKSEEILKIAAKRIELELDRLEYERLLEDRNSELEKRLTSAESTESEEYYRQLADPSELITTQSDNGIFQYVSASVKNLLGYEQEEVVGQSFFDFLHPDDLKQLKEGRINIANGGGKQSVDYRMRRKDGDYIWLESISRVLLNPVTNAISKIVTVSRNITGRKQAEEQVQGLNTMLQKRVQEHIADLEMERLDKEESREKYTALFNATFDSILIGDVNGNITSWNPGAEQKFGYPSKEIIGTMFTKVLSPDYHPLVLEIFELYINQETFHYLPGRVFEVEGLKKNGRTFPAEISFSFWKTQQAKFFSCIIRDISERKRAIEKVEQSERQLKLVIDLVPALISYIDTEYRYKFINESYFTWFGESPGGFVGKHMWEVLGDHAFAMLKPYADKALSGEGVSFEKEIEYVSGKKFVKGQYTPDIAPDGRIHGFVAMINDLSERKQNEEMLQFLNRAGQELSLSLSYEHTFDSIARLAVPHLADWFAIDLYNEQKNTFELLTVAHKDPEKVKWAKELRLKEPPDMNAATGQANVLRTGQSELYKFIPDELLTAAARDEEHLKLIRGLGIYSVIIVPILVGGKVIGTVSFFTTTDSKRSYNEYDLKVAEDFATRVGLALENVRLYQEAKEEIEERKKAEERVNELLAETNMKQERLDNLIGSVPGIVWESAFDPITGRQKVLFISDYAKVMTGYTPGEAYADNELWAHIIHPGDMPIAMEAKEAILSGKRTAMTQLRLIKKNGDALWVESYYSVIYDEHKKPVGVRGVAVDISGVKELEQNKNDFLSIASHELKTPLTSIKAYVQLLDRMLNKPDKYDETVSVYIGKTNTFINKLSDLISDLLDVSKIQAGKMQFELSEFNFDELVKESVENTQYTSYNHKIAIEGKAGRTVTGDKHRLEQVINNFLSNAIKYSPNADAVTVKVEGNDEEVIVGVTDQGMGIPKDKIHRIFERFYRVESLETGISGLGIGLYISNEIIQRHHGKVWVQSEEGKGSTFYFSIPTRQVQEAEPVSDTALPEEVK